VVDATRAFVAAQDLVRRTEAVKTALEQHQEIELAAVENAARELREAESA